MKVAFCGSMGSGKTYASKLLCERTQVEVLSIAKPIKEIVTRIGHGDRASHIMVGMVGRLLSPNVWIDALMESIPDGNVVVDDIRFENEAIALKRAGFVLVYLNTPWHVRFKRVQKRTDDLSAHIQWFAHESEVAPEKIDKKLFDYVCESEEDVTNVINKIYKA